MSCLVPCPDCPFGGPKVGNKGDPNSPFLIIGEGPGKQEVAQKLPFVGPSGKVLDFSLKQIPTGIEPYYINAMQCFPLNQAAMKNEDTLKQGTLACRQRVLDEIAKAPRKVILALGASGMWSATGNFDYKITQQRGKVLESELASTGIIPTVHPAFLMRGGTGATFQQYMRDVKYAQELLLGRPRKTPPNVTYEFVRDYRDIRDLAEYFQSLPEGTVIGSDIETSGFSFLSDRMMTIGFAVDPDQVYVVPKHLAHQVAPLFRNKARFLWHHGKFDVKFLWAMGAESARVDEDTMMLSYAIDENGGIHDLGQVSSDWLNAPDWKGVLDSYLPKKNTSYEVIPDDILYKYMAYDIGNMLATYRIIRPIVAADPMLERLYTRTLIPAANFLARVERNGIDSDLERVSENERIYGAEVAKYRAEILKFAEQYPDAGFSEKLVGSPKQLSKLIYDCIGIKPYRGQRSTGKDVIEKLPPHPMLTSLSKYRKWAKEESTYVRPAREARDKDNKVHSTYSLHKTKTGRLASSEPNLQNVPRNPQVRGQYVAGPGRRFVEPDLNQAELRILACLSNDPGLCHIYETEGMSLHEEMRSFIWGNASDWSPKQEQEYHRKFGVEESKRYTEKGEDRLVEEQKMRAKAVNFGIPYGREAFSIAEEFSISPNEAQGWINAWFKKFPGAHEFLKMCQAAPEKMQVLVTPFGNKRRFGVVGIERLKGMQNEASNFTCQAPASHSTMHAGIELEQEMEEVYDSRVVNLVHDSLLYNVPDDDAIVNAVAKRVIAKMEEIPGKWGFTRIPFVAEAKQGYRWGSLAKFKPK